MKGPRLVSERACWLAATALLVGCQGGFSNRAAHTRQGTFRYPLEKDLVTFDPGRVQDPEDIELLQNVYEGLVAYDEHNQIVPRLAESFDSSAGGKEWTFHLRRGIAFQNGRAVTAEDFRWTFERNLAKTFASPVALNYLSDIQGADAFAAGKGPLSGIRVIDPQTLAITLVEPRPYFLGKLTYPCAFVLPREAAGTRAMVSIGQMVGTGPFKFERIDQDQQVTLVANRDYHGGVPKVGRIERPIVKDPVTRLNLFKKGELDMVGVMRSDVASLQKDPVLKAELRLVPKPTVYYLGMNQHLYPPFKDLRVRRAVAMAIDRRRIAQDLLGGMPEAHGFVTPGVAGYRQGLVGIPYDPRGGQSLLAAAGYPGGKGLPTLEIDYIDSTPGSKVVVEGIHSSLTQNLRFPVQLKAMDASAFFDKRNGGKLPCFFLSWGADYLDPQNFTTFLLRSDSTMDFEGYRNADFDRIGKLADSTVPQGRRIPLYQEAEDILIQDVARVPLYFGQDAELVGSRVSGLRVNLMGHLPHTELTVNR